MKKTYGDHFDRIIELAYEGVTLYEADQPKYKMKEVAKQIVDTLKECGLYHEGDDC
jgi:hypothetical protein